MRSSETIGKLAEALSKAQGTMKNAIKDSDNPFFKSKYADLASVADACRAELAANGLAVSQLPEMREGKLVLTYVLMHSSGEWLSGELEMNPVKQDPQGIGSAITYARRYTLAGIAGIATEDDDGNAASGNKVERQAKAVKQESITIGATPASVAPNKLDYISNKDRGTFIGVYKARGWTDDDIKELLARFNITSRSLIPVKDYLKLLKIVETYDLASYLDSVTNTTKAL